MSPLISQTLLETEFFPVGALEQAVRAEEVLVHLPAFVGRGRQAAREQLLFVLAQAGLVANFFVNSCAFFFHVANLSQTSVRVEQNDDKYTVS